MQLAICLAKHFWPAGVSMVCQWCVDGVPILWRGCVARECGKGVALVWRVHALSYTIWNPFLDII